MITKNRGNTGHVRAGTLRTESKFWTRVVPAQSGCTEWTGPRGSKGSPVATLNGERMCARRAAKGLTTGDYGDGRRSIRCPHNLLCVNPDHTRYSLGEEEMRVIQRLAKQRGANQSAIGRQFGVGRETVSRIASGVYSTLSASAMYRS